MATTYESVEDLADALRRAAEAHGKHEERTGQADTNWPDYGYEIPPGPAVRSCS